MKIKGITFWEQHVEWFVVGLAAALLLGILALQFMGEPNAQLVDGKRVAPAEIDAVLEQKANEIHAQMSRTQADVPLSAQTSWLDQFKTASTSPVSAKPQLLAWQPRLGPGEGLSQTQTGVPFRIAEIPAPVHVRTGQYFDTVVAEALDEHPELANFFPAPHDATWVTAAVEVSIAAVIKQWNEQGPKGEAPLPKSWFNDRVDVVDVRAYRAEVFPDGNLGPEELLPPIPGQISIRPRLNQRVDNAARNEILLTLADAAQRAEIMQPQFFPTKNASWTPPPDPAAGSTAPAPAADDDPNAALMQQLHERKQDIIRVKKQIEARKCDEQGEAPAKPPGGEGAPAGFGFGPKPGGGGGGGGAAPKPAEPKEDPQKPKRLTPCDRLKKQLQTLEEQVKSIEAQLGAAAPKDAPAQPEAKPQNLLGVGEDVVTVWVHDITAKPGKTYRYRIAVDVYNPLFARGLDLSPEQQQLADKFVLTSPASDWSEPVFVHPPLRVFMTNVQPPARATAEVFRFHGGRWWIDSHSVAPGDRIGRETARRRGSPDGLDFLTDWFLLDVVDGLGASTPGERAERVLIQSISQPQLTEVRSWRDDSTSSERRKLKQQVAQAEAEAKALAAKDG